ncbi:ExeM/NucH family extracellular endonuclease [Fibrella aquatilis]|uniref:ExeM/NucH family extracellular endonuclease n=1 Tax=Fibrella aquatilis TaxID=2817059 RepID=A0A939G8Y3_9BACT|nr:ExeM/NucH family extracellular endonuclease [Fibrella aquatilis]MBO0933170.1 ExeM/NucH family extracellular endonuclease [Fibrella aquatilis]
MTNAITITAPNSNIEISPDNTTFSSSFTLPQTTTSATIYARLTGATQGTFSGNIVNASTGATSVNVAASGTVNAAVGTFTRISTIQGSGNAVAVTGAQNIEGIVTRKFAGATGQNGFYVQEEDADQDGNPATSEGIFCYDPAGLFTGNVGDKVQVAGTPAEFASASGGVNSSLTQLANLTSVVNLGASTLPAATNVTLPFAASSGGVSALERYEGMLIQLSAATGNLTVTETFSLRQYGQITLSATDGTNQAGTDGRIDQYTQFNTPSVSGYAAYEAAVDRRQIILDDASSTSYPATIIHSRGGNPLTASNTVRGGDDVASITAVLDERFDGYRLQTNTGVNFNAANPRPATIPNVGGTLKVGFANVLNYFTTFGATNDRGADNATEFSRQRAKVIANLIGTGADVIGLSEIQNKTQNDNGVTALNDLVSGMNAVAGAGTYAFVTPNTLASTDFITVAILYKPAMVSLVGQAVPIPGSFGQGAFGVVGRSAIAQTFQQISGGGDGIFTLVANHWKSKGSSAGQAGDADAGDGQGFSSGTRTRQAQDLLQWINTKPTGTQDPDYLIVGDLNAYASETPLTTLENGGYTALIPKSSYSFAFKGEWGSLDHALANSALQGQVTGATKWYINSDEPTALDYNTENKTTAQQTSLYNADQYRSADHDPLVVGLNLTAALPVQLVNFRASVVGDQVVLNWETTMEKNAAHFVVERSTNLSEFGAIGQVASAGNSATRRAYNLIDPAPRPGTNYYRLRTIDRDGSSELSKVVAATFDDETPVMTLMGNPISDGKIRLAVRNMAGATYQLRTLTGQTIRTSIVSQNDRLVELQLSQAVGAGIYLLEGQVGITRQVVKILAD